MYIGQSNQGSSYLHEIQLNGTAVASSNNSFVHTIQSVRSTDAGTYTCLVVIFELNGVRLITAVSSKVILSGKSTF